MNLNYRGSPTTFLELTSVTHSSHRICWARKQRGTSKHGPQLRRKKSLSLWATGFLVQTFRKAEKPVRLGDTFHVSSIPLYEISTDFWCLSSDCWLWSCMDALDRGSPRSFSLKKDTDGLWRKGLVAGSHIQGSAALFICRDGNVGTLSRTGEEADRATLNKTHPQFPFPAKRLQQPFHQRSQRLHKKILPDAKEMFFSHIPPCLQHSSAYQTGDVLPKGISSFSSQAAPRARTVRDSANQHMSKSLQPDTPASPCVFFPRLTHETYQLCSPDNCCLCCLCAHQSLEF